MEDLWINHRCIGFVPTLNSSLASMVVAPEMILNINVPAGFASGGSYTQAYIYIYIFIHTCTYSYMYIFTYVHSLIYIYIYIHTYVYMLYFYCIRLYTPPYPRSCSYIPYYMLSIVIIFHYIFFYISYGSPVASCVQGPYATPKTPRTPASTVSSARGEPHVAWPLEFLDETCSFEWFKVV